MAADNAAVTYTSFLFMPRDQLMDFEDMVSANESTLREVMDNYVDMDAYSEWMKMSDVDLEGMIDGIVCLVF